MEEITISRSVKRAPSARFKRQIKSDSIGVTPKSCSSIVFIINEDTDQQYTRHTLHRGGKNSVKIAVSSGAGGVVTSGSVTSRWFCSAFNHPLILPPLHCNHPWNYPCKPPWLTSTTRRPPPTSYMRAPTQFPPYPGTGRTSPSKVGRTECLVWFHLCL